MPKVTIEYNLPDEEAEYIVHNKAAQYNSLVHEWTNFLRGKVKYSDESMVKWDDLYTQWWDLCNEEDVKPYGD